MSVAVAGCASIAGTQSACMAKYQYFNDVAQCIWAKKLASSSSSPRAAVVDYEARVGLLEQKVSSGQMTDADAKLALQEYLTRMQASY